MPRTCTICAHQERDAIENALIQGTSFRTISGQYAVSRNALQRHSTRHLPALPEARAAAQLDRATSLRGRLEDLYLRAERILAETEATGRHNVSLASIRELRGILEFAAKLAGMPAAEPIRVQLLFADGSPVEDVPSLRALPEVGEED